jgi:hypothetical protein
MSKILFISAALSLLSGCDGSPGTAQNFRPTDSSKPETFQQVTYRSFNDAHILTLISADEAELQENGTNFLGKYTQQANGLRVVLTILGTSQVRYFTINEYGLKDNEEGVTLLTSANYAAAKERQFAQQREQALKKKAEEARLANSKQETKKLCSFALAPRREYSRWLGPERLTLTDVSVILHYPKLTPELANAPDPTGDHIVYFANLSDIEEISEFYPPTWWFTISSSFEPDDQTMSTYAMMNLGLQIVCPSEGEAKRMRSEILRAFELWKTNFPGIGRYKK